MTIVYLLSMIGLSCLTLILTEGTVYLITVMVFNTLIMYLTMKDLIKYGVSTELEEMKN